MGNNHSLDEIEKKLEKKSQKRERKKKPKMKVSGKSVFELQRLMTKRKNKKRS